MLRVPCEPPLMHGQLYDVDSSPSNGGEAADTVSAAPMPKLNQVWEFLGILSVAPNLTAHKASAGAGTGADVDGVAASFASFGFGALTEPEEELGRNPPSSLVPRLHCLRTLVVLLLHGLGCSPADWLWLSTHSAPGGVRVFASGGNHLRRHLRVATGCGTTGQGPTCSLHPGC